MEEANALIPLLDQVLSQVEQSKDNIREHAERIEVLELLWGDKLTDKNNPDYPELLTHKRAIESQSANIEQLIRDEILGRGLRFPVGGVEIGLVDFPSSYKGQWVYLCWRTGESEVSFWHETDSGYQSRKSITVTQKRKMGKEDDPASLDDSALDF